MATAFIAIPKKKTYRVDWVKPLSGFITSEYGKEMMENHRSLFLFVIYINSFIKFLKFIFFRNFFGSFQFF